MTRKELVLRRPDIEAQKLCKRFCGNVYYPSTLPENDEVEQVLNDGHPGSYFRDDVWIRVVYNRTEQKWKDAGNIETNIEYNFRDGFWRNKHYGHVDMDGSGGWESRWFHCACVGLRIVLTYLRIFLLVAPIG